MAVLGVALRSRFRRTIHLTEQAELGPLTFWWTSTRQWAQVKRASRSGIFPAGRASLPAIEAAVQDSHGI
jgi:hypothetical protein